MNSCLLIMPMLSLIKHACLLYGNDISTVIFNLYKDIVINSLRVKDEYSCYSRFGDMCHHYNIYHIKRVHTWLNISQISFYSPKCDMCGERCYDLVYRCLIYFVINYRKRSFIDDWKYEGTYDLTKRYHTDCFNKKHGLIYDFQLFFN